MSAIDKGGSGSVVALVLSKVPFAVHLGVVFTHLNAFSLGLPLCVCQSLKLVIVCAFQKKRGPAIS